VQHLDLKDKEVELETAHSSFFSLLAIYYYFYYYYYRISHFSALAGKYSPILGCSNQQD